MIKISAIDSLLYLLLLMMSSVSNAQPDIVRRPMDTIACAKSNATFTCVFFFPSGTALEPIWLRNGVDVNLTRHTVVSNRTGSNTPVYIGTMVTVSNITTADDGARYQCSVTTPSSNATLNVGGPPSNVSHINFDEECITSLTVSWSLSTSNPVCNPLTYNVSISPPHGGPFITSKTNITITGLNDGTAYIILVQPINMAGVGNVAQNQTTLPSVNEVLPGKVTDLKNTSFAHNQVVIVWNPANGSRYCGSELIHYNISISNGGDIANKITTGTTATIDGLMSNTTYSITVAAFIMDIGEGMISDPLFITTAARENSGEGGNNNSGGALGVGAIIGIIFGVIVGIICIICGIIGIIYLIKRCNHDQNGMLSSNSTSDKSVEKSLGKQKSKQKNIKQPPTNKTEYAELTLGASGAAPPADPTKVSYTEVKEHEPLGYVEVQHDPGTSKRPIQGAPQVEYKELLHQ